MTVVLVVTVLKTVPEIGSEIVPETVARDSARNIRDVLEKLE
jgi:hypothetical protein